MGPGGVAAGAPVTDLTGLSPSGQAMPLTPSAAALPAGAPGTEFSNLTGPPTAAPGGSLASVLAGLLGLGSGGAAA